MLFQGLYTMINTIVHLQHKRCQLSEEYMDSCMLWVKGDELITK
jgi:hypothetical protein